jgi:hypothetical protein
VSVVRQGLAHAPDALDEGIVGDRLARPDGPDELVLGDEPVGVLDEVTQDVEGLGPERDGDVAPAERAPLQVEGERSEAQHSGGGHRHSDFLRRGVASPRCRRNFSALS